MGVPRLDRYIRVYYGKHITFLKPTDKSKYIKPHVTCIDSNPLVHKACQQVFNYGNEKRILDPYKHLTYDEKVAKAYVLYFQWLKEIVKIALPTETLYVAIDGVAPLAKQVQQRQRRFRAATASASSVSTAGGACGAGGGDADTESPSSSSSATTADDEDEVDVRDVADGEGDAVRTDADEEEERERNRKFDSNVITTGSLFMHNLTKYIHYHTRLEMMKGEWMGIDVVISSHTVPGEGEHKILDYIRTLPTEKSVCMYGPDGDLIMLGLVCFREFYLLKENMYEPEEYYIIKMHDVRRNLVTDMGLYTFKSDVNIKRGIYDFIYIGFFLGNDFLPKLEMFHLLEDGLELFMKLYKQFMCHSSRFIVNEDKTINMKNLKFFLELIQRDEVRYITDHDKIVYSDPKFINRTLEGCMDTVKREGGVNRILNFAKYRSNYYERKLHIYSISPPKKRVVPDDEAEAADEDDIASAWKKQGAGTQSPDYCKRLYESQADGIKRVVFSYLDGMKWILDYYISGCPTMDWVYNYHYPPFMIDIITYVDAWTQPKFKKTPARSPFEQLVNVLPPVSFNILPPPFSRLLKMKQLDCYFSTDIKVDFEGKTQDYQGIVLTPFMNQAVVKKCFDEVVLKETYSRNDITKDKLLTTKTSGGKRYLCNYKSDFGAIDRCTVKSVDL